MHERNDDTLPNVIPFTGRYIQVLVNRGGTSFGEVVPQFEMAPSGSGILSPKRAAPGVGFTGRGRDPVRRTAGTGTQPRNRLSLASPLLLEQTEALPS